METAGNSNHLLVIPAAVIIHAEPKYNVGTTSRAGKNGGTLVNWQPGQSGNPSGRPQGAVNRKTILNYFLFEFDPEALLPEQKPKWWDKVKPKTIYEAATLAMGIQAMSGDTRAFNALNSALGLDINAAGQVDVVHIFKPEKLSIEDFNAQGNIQRELTRKIVEAEEGEVIDGGMESPTGATNVSITNP